MQNNHHVNHAMAQTILKRAELAPATTALTFEGQSQTFGALAERILRTAKALRNAGVSRGDRVGFIGHNHPAFLEILYACSCIGAIFVPLNFRLTSPEVRFIANDAGVKIMFADAACRPLIDAERDALHCRDFIATQGSQTGWQELDAWIGDAEPLGFCEHLNADDVALIMYTSGTTGLPKGAMLTHGNVFWNALNVAFMGIRMKGATLTCAPLFHIGGLNVTTHVSLSLGVGVILHKGFEAGDVLRDIEKYRISTMFGAPTMFLMMSQHENFDKADLSSIISFNVGAAPVPLSLLETYQKRGIALEQGYGLTETSPYVSVLASEHALEKTGSAGQNLTFTSVRIVDEDNQPVAAGERGEVCIKGPNVMQGYWNRPEATAQAIDELGWFHSGDIGYLDEDGFLFICDRLKDMIITGGENVYPAEVESALYDHDDINEVAIFGLPDEKWGEVVVAAVVMNEGKSLELAELRSFAAQSLAKYKIPTVVHFFDELPRNPAGKVQKFILRDELIGASKN